MIDQYGRNITYLRLSVTDQCNLHCIYCSTGNRTDYTQCSAEELIRIVRILADLGITKVRITGGEPLRRKDLEQIIAGISSIKGITDIPMTTNAIGLADRISDLKKAGLSRVNISLDSLKPERYARITGSNALSEVLKGIEAGISEGMNVKINTVLMKGINDDEADDLIALGKKWPVSVRFIEMMPIGNFAASHQKETVLNTEILASHPQLIPVRNNSCGVASVYQMPGYLGTVGFISSISHRFCSSCNRIRITSDGKIKPCLGNNDETDLLPLFKLSDERLKEMIQNAILLKPAGHHFGESVVLDRNMRETGG